MHASLYNVLNSFQSRNPVILSGRNTFIPAARTSDSRAKHPFLPTARKTGQRLACLTAVPNMSPYLGQGTGRESGARKCLCYCPCLMKTGSSVSEFPTPHLLFCQLHGANERLS